jgi:hypothetical protein
MELDILKHFVKYDVEVLVGGVWIEGTMQPISKGIVVLMPFADMQVFYGPASLKTEAIQAIRQVKRNNITAPNVVPNVPTPPAIRSSFESLPPSFRFPVKKEGQP